ncbi:hypothetical protein ISG33_13595 [Glaciecola sp. MH2013]|uniref:hypothetical protein n=1 Tax=Glaciecola sp. MH2013 TaxID=2785524 RepID=UPI00189C6296|nr:hypothetical protein [Glaciecola sp. MH2013]MBF7074435.1 hypothetical protein [Glaciecola sp. MH2013]
MRKSHLPLFLSILLVSCTSRSGIHPPILELAFPEEEYEIWSPEITFQVGYLGNEHGYYGYFIDDKMLYLASTNGSSGRVRRGILKADLCVGLPKQIEKLKTSLLLSSKIALGNQ